MVADEPFAIDNDTRLERDGLLNVQILKFLKRIATRNHLAHLVDADDLGAVGFVQILIQNLSLGNDDSNGLESISFPIGICKTARIDACNGAVSLDHACDLLALTGYIEARPSGFS